MLLCEFVEICDVPDKSLVVELLDGGATIPFISRYRKEATGSMDEVAVGSVKDMHENYDKMCNIIEKT